MVLLQPPTTSIYSKLTHSMLIKEYSNGCKAVLATEDHARELAPLLREYDSIEVSVGQFGDNEEALLYGVRNDDVTITGLDPDGKPIVMFGVGSSDDSIPYIWLLGSKGVRDYWYTFAKASRELLPHLLLDHPCVANIVLKEYDDSVRWLRWLGAKFIREVEINDHQFYEFIITK